MVHASISSQVLAQTTQGLRISTEYNNTSQTSLPGGTTGWNPGATFFNGHADRSGERATPNDGVRWLTQAGFGQPVGSEFGWIQPVSVFDMGEILPLIAVHGKPSGFAVRSSKLGPGASYSFTFSPETYAPRGLVHLDSVTGLFTYTPNPADLKAFTVNIVAVKDGAREEQQVDIEPFPVIPSEFSFLPTGHGLPDAESLHYTVSNAATNEPIVFNDILRPTVDIIVSAKSVPIRNGHANSLALLSGAKNIRSVKIYAETVSIETSVVLADTEVEIYANRVVYKNQAAILSSGLLISTNETGWFTPSVCRMMLAYAKDVYLYGHYAEAGRLFTEIESRINLILSVSQPPAETVEYEQMLGEVNTQVFKLTTLQDYFGYPIGFVPPLSLEYVTALYAAEIGPNLETLYLAHKIQAGEKNIRNRQVASQNAIIGLNADIQASQKALADTKIVIEKLEDESKQLNDDIVSLQRQMQQRSDDLRRKAEKKQKQSKWLQVANTVGAVASAIPHPYAQIAASVIQTGTQIAGAVLDIGPVGYLPGTKNIVQGVQVGSRVLKTFNDAQFGEGIKEFEKCVDDFRLLQPTSSITRCSKNIDAGRKLVQLAWENSKAASEPTLKHLADLKAQNPELNQDGLFLQLQSKMTRLSEVTTQISTNVAYMTHLNDTIYKSHLGIDSLNNAIRGDNSKLDHVALTYVKSMEHRALERLRFYHYLVGKAYEYRLLQPYKGDLKIEDFIPKLNDIVRSGSGADGRLPSTELTNLRGLYEDVLSGITADVVVQALRGQRLETTIDYPLNDEELKRLNAGGQVLINLGDQARLETRGEDFRIVRIELGGSKEIVEDQGRQTGRSLVVDLISSPFGKFRHDTNVIAFGNIAQRVWRASYQSSSPDRGLLQDPDSQTQNTLLRSLLRIRGHLTDDKVALFIQRPAWTQLVLEKRVNNAANADMTLKRFTLRFVLDYLPTNQRVPLHVFASSEEIKPTLIIDREDLARRTHGFGRAYRIYSLNTIVKVETPAVYGSWRFVRWEAASGTPLPESQAGTPSLTLNLGSIGRELKAVYQNTDEDSDGMPDEWELQFAAGGLDPDGDCDGDGKSNLIEYFDGTAPCLTPGPYTLSLSINPPSAGTVEARPAPGANGAYSAGTVVTLTPKPAGQNKFVSWGGALSGSSAPVTITMNSDLRVTANFSSDSFVSRLLPGGYIPGSPLTVNVRATPTATTSSYLVEDRPPAGWAVSGINESGSFDAVNGKVKFGPYFDSSPRTLTYQATPPLGTTGEKSFVGLGSADGNDTTIGGDSVINVAQYHPADSNPADWAITANEITAYGAAWKRGLNWPIAPNPIPADYISLAGSIWKRGETYKLDPSVASGPPRWWVNVTRTAQSLTSSGRLISKSVPPMNRAVSSMPGAYTPGTAVTVAIAVSPASDVTSYVVEDQPPQGWTVSTINESGFYDANNRKVKWGPFFDNAPRNLGYQVAPPSSAAGDAAFVGLASFDGINIPISGQRTLSAATFDAISIRSPRIANNGILQFSVAAPIGRKFTVEFAAHLGSGQWISLITIEAKQPETPIEDSMKSLTEARFYRVRLQP